MSGMCYPSDKHRSQWCQHQVIDKLTTGGSD